MQRPLEGIRVIEKVAASAPLHVRLAVAMAGKIAGELGAEVVLFEPDGGEPLRKLPPFLKGDERRSALFEFLSGAKHVIPPQGHFDLAARAAQSDVLLADTSASISPQTNAVIVSSFGPHQTELSEPASEFTIMAMSGVLHLIGEQAGEPFRLPGHQPAYAAGLAAFLAMTAGLLAPKPKVADVCLLDALLWVNWKVVSEPLLKPAGQAVNEWQVVEAADGHVALVYMDRDWPALAELVGDARLREARFAARPSRLAHLGDLMAILRPWFATRGKADIYREAKRRGLPLGPVWAMSDLLRDAQYLERDFWAMTPAGVMPRLPVMWNGARPRTAHLAREQC